MTPSGENRLYKYLFSISAGTAGLFTGQLVNTLECIRYKINGRNYIMCCHHKIITIYSQLGEKK